MYFTSIFPYILLSIYPKLCTSRLFSPTSYSLSNPGCVLHVYLPLHPTLYVCPGCVLHVYLPLHPTLYLTQVVYSTSIFPYILLSIYPKLCTSRLSSPTSYSLSNPGCVLHGYLPLHLTLYLSQVVYFTAIFPYILLSIYPRLCTSRLSSPTSYSLSIPGCVLHVYLPLHPTLYLSQVVYFTSIFPYILLSI